MIKNDAALFTKPKNGTQTPDDATEPETKGVNIERKLAKNLTETEIEHINFTTHLRRRKYYSPYLLSFKIQFPLDFKIYDKLKVVFQIIL